MFQVITAVLLGWMWTFILLQFRPLQSVHTHDELYVRAIDVVIMMGLTGVFTLANYVLLGLVTRGFFNA